MLDILIFNNFFFFYFKIKKAYKCDKELYEELNYYFAFYYDNENVNNEKLFLYIKEI